MSTTLARHANTARRNAQFHWYRGVVSVGQQLRAEIQAGRLRGAALRDLVCSIPRVDREVWIDEVLGMPPAPPTSSDLPRGGVPYLPAGVDEILAWLDEAGVTAEDSVVDLGCAYTMEVDEAGVGRLRVTSGWASLEFDKLESLVPSGASCPTRPGVGPGTPAFEDATEQLRQALIEFDYSSAGSRAVDVVLAESRQRDTLTLWHLLSRVELDERRRILDRMVALTPLPNGVTREKALALDPATLKLWREELAWTW